MVPDEPAWKEYLAAFLLYGFLFLVLVRTLNFPLALPIFSSVYLLSLFIDPATGRLHRTGGVRDRGDDDGAGPAGR